MKETREAFAEQRYIKLDALLEDGLIHMLYKHVMRRAETGLPAGMGHNGMAVDLFAEPLREFVLAGVQPRIEELSGLILAPRYSFVRIYRHGNDLKRHRDRLSCEVSVSLKFEKRPMPGT